MTAPGETPAAPCSTVLVVDDQPSIIRALELGLRRRNFRVLTAGNGRDALAILESQQGVDVLVSDIVMPGGISGLELARLARALRPGLPVLLITGFFNDDDESRAGGYDVIAKPFSVADLVSRINGLLVPPGAQT